jgi:disulfide oxidoreductase YuzD
MERLAKAVKVTIVFNSRIVQCEGHCGLDWSSAETVEMVKKRMTERFGKTIKLELLDVSSAGERNTDWQKRLEKENLSLPLLLVNNEIRIPGEFDIRQMMDTIEVEQEING